MLKKIFYNPIVLVFLGSGFFYDLIKSNKVLPASIWTWIKSFLLIKVSVWILILVVLFLVAIIIFIIKFGLEQVPPNQSPSVMLQEKVTEYQADNFNMITWHWNWRKNPYTKEYEPIDVTPLCTRKICDYNVMKFESVIFGRSSYRCDKCRQTLEIDSTPEYSQMVIRNNAIRKFG